MKRYMYFLLALPFLATACGTSKTVVYHDDIYYTEDDVIVMEEEVKQQDNNYSDYSYEGENNNKGYESYKTEDGQGNTYITNNYYDDHDYYYTSRLRRFHSPYVGFSYYSPVYTDYYWYTHDPFYSGVNIYIGWGRPWYSPYYSYHRPWGWSHHNYGYYGYNSYWNGYNHGFHDGLHAGYHGYGNPYYGYGYGGYGGHGGYYGEPTYSYNPDNYYYGPRNSSGTNVVQTGSRQSVGFGKDNGGNTDATVGRHITREALQETERSVNMTRKSGVVNEEPTKVDRSGLVKGGTVTDGRVSPEVVNDDISASRTISKDANEVRGYNGTIAKETNTVNNSTRVTPSQEVKQETDNRSRIIQNRVSENERQRTTGNEVERNRFSNTYEAPQRQDNNRNTNNNRYTAPERNDNNQRTNRYETPQRNERPERNYEAPQRNNRQERNYEAPQRNTQPQRNYQAPQRNTQPQRNYQAPQRNTTPQRSYTPSRSNSSSRSSGTINRSNSNSRSSGGRR